MPASDIQLRGARRVDDEFVSRVEPFVDVSLAAMRRRMIDEAVVRGHAQALTERLGELEGAVFNDRIVQVLAEIRADIHLLMAAWMDQARQVEPPFDTPLQAPNCDGEGVDRLVVDFRSDITGRNWHHAEADGRWAGPGLRSTLVVPALRPGRYRVSLRVVAEFVEGTVASMRVTVNGDVLVLAAVDRAAPLTVSGIATVDADHDLPFWTLGFDFGRVGSPAEHGSSDVRKLAIQVAAIEFDRIDA